MKLFIPTYARVDRQITFDGLPDKWKDNTFLIATKEEAKLLRDKGYPALECPVQGQGLPLVRNWIMHKMEGKGKYGVLDDDLYEFVYTARPSERENYRLVNTPITGVRVEPGFEDHFDKFIEWVEDKLDECVTCAAQTTWIPPFEEDDKYCFRQSGNHFYNGDTFPANLIDHTKVHCAEDFYAILTLLTNGYQNCVSMRWRVRPSNTADAGGCSTYRDIEMHNSDMEKLKELFPDFVTLKEKTAKVGEWGGKPKLAANIQWKKAYASSQKKDENTLESMFE